MIFAKRELHKGHHVGMYLGWAALLEWLDKYEYAYETITINTINGFTLVSLEDIVDSQSL